MKQLIFAVLFVSVTTIAYGQYVPKGKTSKAEIALQQGKLDIAKAEIDEAFKVDNKGKVTGSAKNWYTRGKIYKSLYLDDSSEYKDLGGVDALKKAMESYSKVKEMDKETSSYYVFSDQDINQLYGTVVNKGAEEYNEDKFKEAYEQFMTALIVQPGDTTALLYGGVSAQQAGMADEALSCFETLVENGDANLDTYKTIIFMYRTDKKDMDSVLKYVDLAIKKFPENTELVQEKITTLILMEEVEKAKTELEAAINNEPTNYLYYYFLGYLYDQQEDRDGAIENYGKCVELNPEYYEANYNLGVVYYNKARDIISELNNLPLDEFRKKEQEYIDKASVHFKESLPYFEKAAEIKPDEDVQLLETLQGVYIRLKMTDKADSLEARIKKLNGQ